MDMDAVQSEVPYEPSAGDRTHPALPPTARAITLWQPWATLLASGRKAIETRSWSTDYRGLVLVHAGKAWNESCEWAIEQPVYKSTLSALLNTNELRLALPVSAIVGLATLVDVIPTEVLIARGAVHEVELKFGDYRAGRFGWVCKDAVLLDKPIVCSGARGLWVPTPVMTTAALKAADDTRNKRKEAQRAGALKTGG